MAGTLYTYPESFRGNKVLIAAQYSGAELKVVSEAPEFQLGKTNKTEEFLTKFPLGKVPAFETADGTPIYESNAIAYYVSNGQLRGTTELDAALVQQYVNFADSEILPAACAWVFPTLGIMQYNKQATEQAQGTIRKVLEVLDAALATRTFLVGERVTLADITVVCNLLMLYKQVLEPSFRAPYVNVNRWFVTCINQPQFIAVLGTVALCTKMAQFDAKKYNELFPKERKEKKKKEEQPKKQPKQPAKQQPKEQPKEQEEEEEEDRPKEPKFKDPYIALPKSSFNLDAFKRVYSNEDTATKAVPYFWENFDPEGWSIWKADYNYNDDLKYLFMSSNLVSGMMQRLDKLRKYAFASVLILGQDNDNCISGIWVMRGQELAFDLVEDWNMDAGSYTFVKLDPSNPDHKKMVDEYLLWEGDFGKEVADGKIYKKDHVHRELQTSRKWPDTWGFLAAHYHGKCSQQPAVQPKRTTLHIPPVQKPFHHRIGHLQAVLSQRGAHYPRTTASEVGWRCVDIKQLERFGRHARGQQGIRKLLNWPREGIL